MSDKRLYDALRQIAEVVNSALGEKPGVSEQAKPGRKGAGKGTTDAGDTASGGGVGCVVKDLPKNLLVQAATTAIQTNPANAPVVAALSAVMPGLDVIEPLHLALLTSKYWGPSPRRLTVSFVESTPNDLKNRLLSHMNAWGKTCCISFALTGANGNVRVSRGQGGYWSYLGTDILHIPRNQPTMNLQAFTMKTRDSEFYRVVRHETGHTLGFPHEHMRREVVDRIDPEKAYQWFQEYQGWDRQTVDAQVLTALEESEIVGNATDVTSIMCYQLPADITVDGQPVPGGNDINVNDYNLAGRLYPKSRRGPSEDTDWTHEDSEQDS
jgi:hypothetical protein